MSAPCAPSSVPGKLEVRVLKGEDMTNMETFGKQDPYVKVSLFTTGDARPKEENVKKTKVIKKGGSKADWQEIFMFDTNKELDQIKFEAWDEDKLSDDLIGTVGMNLSKFIETATEPAWFPLLKDGKDQGKLQLCCKFTPYVSGQLYVHLIKAQDLKDHDIGKQDPYCVFTIDGKQERKSAVVKSGGSDPEWEDDQKFSFAVSGKEKWLTCKLFDEDLVKDDFIAGARIDLRKLKMATKKETGEMVIKLGQGEHFDKKKRGNLILSLSFEEAPEQ